MRRTMATTASISSSVKSRSFMFAAQARQNPWKLTKTSWTSNFSFENLGTGCIEELPVDVPALIADEVVMALDVSIVTGDRPLVMQPKRQSELHEVVEGTVDGRFRYPGKLRDDVGVEGVRRGMDITPQQGSKRGTPRCTVTG